VELAAHRRVAQAALDALIFPSELAPPGFNSSLRGLWSRLQHPQEVPTSDELAALLESLFDLLRTTALPGGIAIKGERAQALRAAKYQLDLLLAESVVSGLLVEWPEGD
jgi:hypothetical protein